jgi:hypothetical protein
VFVALFEFQKFTVRADTAHCDLSTALLLLRQSSENSKAGKKKVAILQAHVQDLRY